ncbi:hypothetical protein [Kineococcus aurantiacus]|uniref:Uncharacterized protein n=1 Tax=Kineococcus aurantiacus TaxID=37633 RepID=A0A7Y9ART5_9ACTN|nr:hypothetical protein [Kineococcus aurantiacus]NYD20808.1 hypothetical protein [Kineococcus aurantiacus]
MNAPGRHDAVRRPRRARGTLVGAAVTLAVVAALTTVLDDRSASATEDLRGDLREVAAAQTRWRAGHGSYSTSLEELGVTPGRGDLAIVSAGADGFCAGAYDRRSRTALFYAPATGLTDRACS